MQRIQLYLKVVIDAGDEEKPERLGVEVCRQVKKVYGVRQAEVSNLTVENIKVIE